MSNKRDEFQQQLELLQRSYAEQLVERGEKIAAQWREFRSGQQPSSLRRSFYDEVHQLAGGAGTFGFHEVSVTAQRLSRLVIPQDDVRLPEAVFPEVEQALDALLAAIRTGVDTGVSAWISALGSRKP